MVMYCTMSGVAHSCSIHDQEERAATELQIREFGQTPRRLFVLPHPRRLSRHGDRVGGVVVEEEVRTVGATTEGLSRMDSSSSWSHTSLISPSREDQEWIHVDLPAESGKVSSLLQHVLYARLYLSEYGNSSVGHGGYSITFRHKLQVHKE